MLGKLSDKDYRFWRFTIGICEKRTRTSFSYFHLETDHYPEDDGPTDKVDKFYNTLTCKFGKLFSIRILLPAFIKPAYWKVKPTRWSEETIKRLGRDWYYEYKNRCYGFSFDKDYLNLKWGITLNDCGMIVSREKFFNFPWKVGTYIKTEYFDIFGNVQNLEYNRTSIDKKELTMTYANLRDFDGEEIKASFMKVVRTYYRYSDSLLWLAKLLPKQKYASLEINFDGETGAKKGSWKGGTIGISTPIDLDKDVTEAFLEHCAKQRMTFIEFAGFGKGPIPYRKKNTGKQEQPEHVNADAVPCETNKSTGNN